MKMKNLKLKVEISNLNDLVQLVNELKKIIEKINDFEFEIKETEIK